MDQSSDTIEIAIPEPRGFRTSRGSARVVNSARELSEALRGRVLARHCKDLRYHEIIEQTLQAQFQQRYLVLENEQSGEIAVQPFFFVDQDLTAGLPERLRRPIEMDPAEMAALSRPANVDGRLRGGRRSA